MRAQCADAPCLPHCGVSSSLLAPHNSELSLKRKNQVPNKQHCTLAWLSCVPTYACLACQRPFTGKFLGIQWQAQLGTPVVAYLRSWYTAHLNPRT